MIAIKGMEEMPSCCYECPYFDDYCKLTSKWERDTEQIRDADCPLVEVVTCKDCKHNYENSCDLDGYGIDDDFYCANGERKENEKNNRG